MNKELTKKTGLAVALVLIMLGFAILACSDGGSAAPAPAPTPVPSSEQRTFPVGQIYDEALVTSAAIVQDVMEAKAIMTGIAYALFGLAAVILLSYIIPWQLSFVAAVIVAIGAFVWGHGSVARNIEATVADVSHAQANVAINDGVAKAQKSQASNFQYIAATISAYGVSIMTCTDPINHHSDCSAATDYYTHREINSHQVCTTSTDSNGDTHESCHEEHDDLYVSWFPYLVRYWVAPATKAKYLFEGLDDFRCLNPETSALEDCHRDEDGVIDDKRQPAIFLHPDWRAPVGVDVRGEARSMFGSYKANTYQPLLWQHLDSAKKLSDSGQSAPTITMYVVSKYFHWGFGARSTWATVFDGPYKQLKSLVTLPGPNGQWYNYTDLQGRTVSMNTLLRSEDGDLATILDPVFFVGFDATTNPALMAEMNAKAREYQGTYGPGKESINYVVVVNTKIVQQMGGIQNTTTAIIGWLQDEQLWGLFRMPKNQTLVVVEAAPDLSSYSSQNFDTGLPFGNDLVKRDVRLALTESKPLSWETLMGVSTSTYLTSTSTVNPGQNWGQKLGYQFSDMTHAGGIISLLYENELPEYADKYPQPDPNSDDCTTAQPEHVGYIRYQMCTQQYLSTTIQINEDGKLFIMNSVIAGSNGTVNNSGEGWWIFFAVIFVIAVAAFRTGAINFNSF